MLILWLVSVVVAAAAFWRLRRAVFVVRFGVVAGVIAVPVLLTLAVALIGDKAREGSVVIAPAAAASQP